MTIKNKKNFDSYQAQLLLQCIGEFGYGNWEDISIQYNRTINEEYYKGNRAYLSVKGQMPLITVYLLIFYVDFYLCV